MDFKDCVNFAIEVHDCYLATVEGDQPRVRALGMLSADETGFYFMTESVKAMYKQLQNNKKVEAIFHSRKPEPGKPQVLRVNGEVKFIDDIAFRTRVYEDRKSFMDGLGVKGPEDPFFVIFCIAKGEAYFWSFANNMKEAEIERIKFGS